MYDVLCAKVWDKITLNMAQSIDDQNRGDHLKRRNLERFAEDAGLNPKSMINRISGMLDRCEMNLARARQAVASMPAGDHDIMGLATTAIKERIVKLRDGMEVHYGANERVSIGGQKIPTPNVRDDYVQAMEMAKSRTDFQKIVRRLEKDQSKNAAEVKSIAQEVLGGRFSSKKAAIEALKLATQSQNKLF